MVGCRKWMAQQTRHLLQAGGWLSVYFVYQAASREQKRVNWDNHDFRSVLCKKKKEDCPGFPTKGLVLCDFPWRTLLAKFSTPWNKESGWIYFQHSPGNEAVRFINLKLEDKFSFFSRCGGMVTKFTVLFPKVWVLEQVCLMLQCVSGWNPPAQSCQCEQRSYVGSHVQLSLVKEKS